MNARVLIASSMMVLLLLLAVWTPGTSHAGRETEPLQSYAQQRGATLAKSSDQTGTRAQGMPKEEKVVRDVYTRLMRYQSAGQDERNVREGASATPTEYLTIELSDIKTGPLTEIINGRLSDFVSLKTGLILNIQPVYLSGREGLQHAFYNVSWQSNNTGGDGMPVSTVEEKLKEHGDDSSEFDRYTSYIVTIKYEGRERTYNSLALHSKGANAAASSTTIIDNVLPGIGTVLTEESPRIRSPWETYKKSVLHLAVVRTIKERKATGQPLIPPNAPIGYLPGDDVIPESQDLQAIVANSCFVPTVAINSINIDNDAIQTTLGPANTTGTFTLRWVGANASFTLKQETRNAGTHTDSFQIANLPNGADYTSLEATYRVDQQTANASQAYHMTVLGDYINTCYNTSLETDFGGTSVNAGTATAACVWSSRSFIADFLDAVNLNGSGVDSSGTSLQIEGFCGGAPATSPPYGGNRYRRPTNIRTSCNESPTVDWTVASRSLGCGTPIFINTIGRRLVQDTGGGLANDQVDNYKGIGRPVCTGWSNHRRKTVQLY